MYIVDLWNRLWQKEKFWLPTHMTMELLWIWSYNTYNQAYKDLVERWFIKEIKKSINQHSARIVALSKTDKATDKALDKATIKATDKATDIIDNNITNKQKNNNDSKKSSLTTTRKEEMFSEFRKVYPNKQWKAKAEEWYLKNITEELHKEILKWVQAYKRTTEEKKSKKEFAPEYKHWSTFLNQRWWEDFTGISEEEAFREAYEKWDYKIYSWWCKNEIGDSRSVTEDYYKPYNDLKSAILQKNNERDWYNNFISCYQTKWKK